MLHRAQNSAVRDVADPHPIHAITVGLPQAIRMLRKARPHRYPVDFAWTGSWHDTSSSLGESVHETGGTSLDSFNDR